MPASTMDGGNVVLCVANEVRVRKFVNARVQDVTRPELARRANFQGNLHCGPIRGKSRRGTMRWESSSTNSLDPTINPPQAESGPDRLVFSPIHPRDCPRI